MGKQQADPIRYSHHDLPAGTVLIFESKKGNRFRVKLLPGLFEKHSRYVEVLEAPIKYNPRPDQPTSMCVVPPKAKVKIMAHAYAAALKMVGDGDVVYLMDKYEGGPVDGFAVKSVEMG